MPVDNPVLMFVIKFDPAFRLIAPPLIMVPAVPVSNPAELTAPVPVAEIFPVVVTASPAVVGDSVVPDLCQYPSIPVVGGVDVRRFAPLV